MTGPPGVVSASGTLEKAIRTVSLARSAQSRRPPGTGACKVRVRELVDATKPPITKTRSSRPSAYSTWTVSSSSSPSRREAREPQTAYRTRGGPAHKPPARGSMTRMQGKVTPTKAGTTGHCIRCGEDIPLNAKKPLCPTDYKQWEKYKNHDYPEKYCYKCGREYSTTFDKPLCLPCSSAC